MRNDLPFLSLKVTPLNNLESDEQSDQGSPNRHNFDPAAQPDPASKQVSDAYDAIVKVVQGKFQHLSIDDIYFPPRGWFDAALARQIALHILNNEFGIPRRRISRELDRSRATLVEGMRSVDFRMENPEFEKTYKIIADVAKTNFSGKQDG